MLRTRAFIVPWRACLWFLRNFGSVPFNEGYLQVFGFLILIEPSNQYKIENACAEFDARIIAHMEEDEVVPIAVSLLGLIVLRRVLGF
jgi:hypothetical protein